MKKTIFLMVVILSISILSGCVGDNSRTITNANNTKNLSAETKNVSSETKDNDIKTQPIVANIKKSDNKGSDWCVPGDKLSEDKDFTIVGLTTYKGVEVCSAEFTYGGGKSVKYFSKDGEFKAMVSNSSSGNAYSEARVQLNNTVANKP